VTFHFGSWLIPMAITVAATAFALRKIGPEKRGDYVFYGPVALMVSLSAWLIWTIIR
jgi:hypothetical protein